MAKFDIDRNGYKISEVDDYIDSITLKYEKRLSEKRDKVFALRNENGRLENALAEAKLNEDELSKALIFAVEKSEQIEKSSKKLYDLEVRRMRLLYIRWKEVMDLMDRDTYTGLKNGRFASALQEFENDLAMVIAQNESYESRLIEDESIKENLKENSSNFIKNLLNRMDYLVSSVNEKEERKNKKKEKDEIKESLLKEEVKKENSKLLNINRRFSKISSKLGISAGINILDDEISEDNAYYRNITNKVDDDRFDLDAILNPKEDLDEIMKAFEDI